MEKFLNPTHPVRCNITTPSECGQSVFLTNFISNFINEFEKKYISYSPSLHQDLYQKLIKCFSNYIPFNIKPKILNEEDINIVSEKVCTDKNPVKSDCGIGTYESIEEINYLQDNDKRRINILYDLKGKEMNVQRVQALFEHSRHNNLSIFIIGQENYDLPRRTTRANANIYHIFEPNNFRDFQNLFLDKASIDIKIIEFTFLIYICWDKKHQPLRIDMTKDK